MGEETRWFFALIVTLTLHTGALFYWGGGIRQMLKDHDGRIRRLEGAEDRRQGPFERRNHSK